MRIIKLASAVSTLLLASAAPSSTARAESAATGCLVYPEVFPRTETPVPANVPAIVFSPPTTTFVRDAADDFALELRGPDGKLVPFTTAPEGARLLVKPTQPLAVGMHVLSFRDYCVSFGSGRTEHRFQVVAAVPLPTNLGTVITRDVTYNQPACSPYRATFVVDLAATPELAAFRGVTRARLVFRDQAVELDYRFIQWTGPDHLGVPVDFSCDRDTKTVAGKLELTVHIAGAADDAPAVGKDVTVLCPIAPEKVPPLCATDGGPATDTAPDMVASHDPPIPTDAQAATDVGAPATPDAGATDAAAPPKADAGATTPPTTPAPADDDGGCTLARHPRAPGAAAMLAAGLLALIATRRQRR